MALHKGGRIHGRIFCRGKFCRVSKFRDNSVAENNPTFAYTIIIFLDGIGLLLS